MPKEDEIPIKETNPIRAANPYSISKSRISKKHILEEALSSIIRAIRTHCLIPTESNLYIFGY